MSRRKEKSGRLSVFKGREARLNKAIFHVLALKGPLTIYEISKEVKAQKGLKHTKYTNINRRVRALEGLDYLAKIGLRKTQAGFQAVLYQLTPRAYLALLLNQINLDKFVNNMGETGVIAALASFIGEYNES